MKPSDLLGREININDYVVFTNNLYRVEGIGTARNGCGPVRIMLVNASKTTRPVIKYSQYMCKVSEEDVIAFFDKQEQV